MPVRRERQFIIVATNASRLPRSKRTSKRPQQRPERAQTVEHQNVRKLRQYAYRHAGTAVRRPCGHRGAGIHLQAAPARRGQHAVGEWLGEGGACCRGCRHRPRSLRRRARAAAPAPASAASMPAASFSTGKIMDRRLLIPPPLSARRRSSSLARRCSHSNARQRGSDCRRRRRSSRSDRCRRSRAPRISGRSSIWLKSQS